jgi:hypothetical protein
LIIDPVALENITFMIKYSSGDDIVSLSAGETHVAVGKKAFLCFHLKLPDWWTHLSLTGLAG